MARTAVLGFPRIGPHRELKLALENYWAGRSSAEELRQTAAQMRAVNLTAGLDAGIGVLPVGDFAYYDHVLEVAELVGMIAPRHRGSAATGLDDHFLACRGGDGIAPLEMTKWFDTNYHFLVPELTDGERFAVRAESLAKWTGHLEEARGRVDTAGSGTVGGSGAARTVLRPVLIGPFTLLSLAKGAGEPLARLGELVEVYLQVLAALRAAGATEVQLDEPALVLDRTDAALNHFTRAYQRLAGAGLPIALATYFDGLDDAVLEGIGTLPLAELHVDLVRAPERLEAVLDHLPSGARLSAGVIDGRNVWATDLDRALDRLERIVARIGTERLTIAPSCSLLHVPYSVAAETKLDPELRSWLAFGDEKLAELTLLERALAAVGPERDALLADARARSASRRSSPRTHDDAVRRRASALTESDYDRATPRGERLTVQASALGLPELPTTTIGSYPQTAEIRQARAARRSGELSDADYVTFLQGQIDAVIAVQEELGLDVLVHGEPERNDMVEYFGEQLDGFAFSQYGWVQSYGSRAVKPPILYGDVSRPRAMTVDWWRYAQSRTVKPVKGMLTGPVTILQWSFVRDDQPRRETCVQIALAIHDEVADLEAAGAQIIQIDEAALREGLPLKHAAQADYVRWAIDCFRLTAASADARTQIHTHMCYSEFEEMIEDIARLDADVISIEASRSGMVLLEAFRDFDYPGQIGPGVYDIHSPRVPSVEEIESLLTLAEDRIPPAQLWVNPDCGLKTRAWPETHAALENLVTAAGNRRAAIAGRH